MEYASDYHSKLADFTIAQKNLLQNISSANLSNSSDIEKIKFQIDNCRMHLKSMDFWLRYLEPISYKKINGPLPVEWETEVFEKFEKPYKRLGAGLTLAALYLEESSLNKDSLFNLIASSTKALEVYKQDSITTHLSTPDHFFLCNRLFLLNLAAIYTTGFECPDTARVIIELRYMLTSVKQTYENYNSSFPDYILPNHYLSVYQETIDFANSQPQYYSSFDHFTFLKNYINPLFAYNQELIRQYKVVSKSYVDYSLTKTATSIFSKSLYNGQNAKGIYIRVKDPEVLEEIDKVGKLLFYDPILSGNNQRSCVSCHKSTEYFTDTNATTSLDFDRKNTLSRNTPSLINVGYNHLIMMDGKHISLQNQTKSVITNVREMGSTEEEVLKRVLSCKDYKKVFTKLLKHTPQEKEITFDHITSAVTLYYNKFSNYYAPFDEAMNNQKPITPEIKTGFNLFMGKAQCATCHFVPQFNGVKPPFVNSEFEVIGVPNNKNHKLLSEDKGRYEINAAAETSNAFRTGSLRNAQYTKPYMHNGAFSTLSEVIDFYNEGGGAGRGLNIPNQTLSSDSLKLSPSEKQSLIAFISSLNENIKFESFPAQLPLSKNKAWNNRKVAGEY